MTPYVIDETNTLCVRAAWLYDKKKGIITKSLYDKLRRQGWAVSSVSGGPRCGLVQFEHLRPDIKEQVRAIAGDPNEVLVHNPLKDLIRPDKVAETYYADFRKDNGMSLSEESQSKYTTNACIYNAINRWMRQETDRSKNFSKKNITKLWKKVSGLLNRMDGYDQHSLPTSYRRLRVGYEKYFTSSGVDYYAIIHRNEGNSNSLKIKGEIADWWISKYAQPNKIKVPMLMYEYDELREAKGWPELTVSAVQLFLDRPENKRIWTLGRHGRERWQNTFGHYIKRDKRQWFPNAYWAIDGTKFDAVHYFDNAQGMAARMKIDPVFDVYSEAIIGWSFSETENHVDHFTAFQSAMNTAGCRPLLITYDNQSGHKMKRMQELYSSIVARTGGTHYAHKARRHGSPVENMFNRFQQQFLSVLWFSDKQSPTVRDIDNKPNWDFIDANKEHLPTQEHLVKVWEMLVMQWNEARHPHTGKSRIATYKEEMPVREEVDMLDMISIFWIKQTRPITYGRGGLTMKVAGKTYEYEVYDTDGAPDLDFRQKYVGAKLIVRYNPEYMDQYIQLYEKTASGLVHIANAEPKHGHEVIPALMDEGDKADWLKDYETTELEYERDQASLKAVRKRTGITPEQLIEDQELMIKMGGRLPKTQRTELESSSIYSRL